MSPTTNPWCEALQIPAPQLTAISPEALRNNFALLVAALLERGAPMTLHQVASRASEAGLGDALSILLALERCRPGRAPVFRDGNRYALDPLDPAIRFWPMRLGVDPRLNAPRAPRAIEPTPPEEVPLSVAELTEAWRQVTGSVWSGQRVFLATLDAHRRPMSAAEVEDFLRPIAPDLLPPNGEVYTRRGGPMALAEDGRLTLTVDAEGPLRSARRAVRARLRTLREAAAIRLPPEEFAERHATWMAQEQAKAAVLGARRHAVIAAFPKADPVVVAVVDVEAHTLASVLHPEEGEVVAMLAGFDAVCGLDVRALLHALKVEPGERRALELGGVQKGRQLNRAGRTLRITPTMLIEGSCGIERPLGDAATMRGYVLEAAWTKLVQRVEADAKSLAAMFSYGRLHGSMRLRWRALDECVVAPWSEYQDPLRLYALKQRAQKEGRPLEVVLRSVAWEDPWSRAVEVEVRDIGESTTVLLKDGVELIRKEDVVAARVKV